MKKIMILAMMMVMTISANAMSYNAAKNEALFLSDKMAYELNLTAAQYEPPLCPEQLAVRQVCGSLTFLSPSGLEGRCLDICSVRSLQQRSFLQRTPQGVRDLQRRPQQDSWLTLCSHAQARSTSPRSSCAPFCTCSASPKGSSECWQASRYYKPHLGKQHSAPRPQQRRSLWTQIKSTFCLYICLQKGHGEFSEMGVPFLFICKTHNSIKLS